jgi:hypothetical protein
VSAEASSETIIAKVPGGKRPWRIGCHLFCLQFHGISWKRSEAFAVGQPDREVVDAIAAREDCRGKDI